MNYLTNSFIFIYVILVGNVAFGSYSTVVEFQPPKPSPEVKFWNDLTNSSLHHPIHTMQKLKFFISTGKLISEILSDNLGADGLKEGFENTEEECKDKDGVGHHGGCHQDFCWAYCGNSNSKGAWCYTTRNHTSSTHEYVPCKKDSDCNGCWKCVSFCTV